MTKSIIQVKSYEFALNTIKLYKELSEKKEFVLSKQLLRSGTSIGANIRESKNAQSKSDFIHKLYISQKECAESIYWLELLKDSEFINEITFEELNSKANEILKMLKSSILTTKANMIKEPR